MTDPNAPPKPRLSTEGNVYVTLLAAEQFLDATSGLGGVEEARRALTGYMLDAYRTGDDPSAVRYRSAREGIDISARASREGRLVVIVSCAVRTYNGGSGGAGRSRRIVR